MQENYKERAPQLFEEFLSLVGENVKRDGLVETPERVARMYKELLGGYDLDPAEIMKTFDVGHSDGLVCVTQIPFYSLCEHHMIPFFGVCHIGYIPGERVLGLSKFARLVDLYARRLQVQEHLNVQIAETLMKYLNPKGVIVLTSAEHLCMAMRGVKKGGVMTRVITKKGEFEHNQQLVDDFLGQC